jgi:hypothetical protein
MMADIRGHASLGRTVFSRLEPPDELAAGLGCLQAVLHFLQKQPGVMARGDLASLSRLNAALCDLSVGGKVHDLLKPVKKSGRPGIGMVYEIIQVIAARALTELIEAGEDRTQSATRIARAIKAGRRDMGSVKAATVLNWRDRMMQGPGPGASEQAVLQYRMPVAGDTPKARGEILLKALAQRSAKFA